MYKYDIDKRRKDRSNYSKDRNVFKKVEAIGRRCRIKWAVKKEIENNLP